MAFPKVKKFRPKNPKKYMGDPTDIVSRSSWETKFFKRLDESSNVIGWNSEVIVVPYLSPIDNKMHRYFVDVLVAAKNQAGETVVTLIEIKPYAQTKPPKNTKTKKPERLLTETKTYIVNQAKWKAATAYCASKGWIFKIVTERDINF